MRKLVKAAIAAGACLVLTGCPKATSVTGQVRIGLGALGSAVISPGDTLTPGDSYYVFEGASITVTYDNGKTCTFNGPASFVPGNDGSVCEKKDNDDKKKDKKDEKDEKKDQDQSQDQQRQSQQTQDQPANGGTNGASGINAPAVAPTPVPQYSGGGGGGGGGGSGIGGPQVIASAVPTYTRIMSVVTNPIVTNTLAVIGGLSVAKEVHDQTNGNNGDKPVSK